VSLQRLRGQQGLVRSSAVVFAGNSTARLLGFLFAVAAARILGTQDFGRFAFGLTVASIAAILITNTPRGLSRFLARAHDDRQEQDNYFSNWLVVVAITLGVSVLLLAPISALTGIEGWMVVAVGANLLGVTVFETYREAQRGLRRFTAMVVFYLAANLIQLFAILLAGRLGWRSPSLFLTIYGLASLAALVVMQRASPIALSFRRDVLEWRLVRAIVRFVRPLVAQTIFYAIWFGADILLLGRLVGPFLTGNYAAAKTLVTVLALVPFAIGIVTGPEAAQLRQRGVEGLRRFALLALGLTAVATAPIAAVLVWFKEPIILFLFGTRYPLASRPMTLLVVGMSLYGLSVVLENLWVGLGQPRVVAVASGLAMLLTVGLGLILVPQLADIGAAIAFAGGAGVQLTVIGLYTVWVLYSGSTIRTQSIPDRSIIES
jgi:O-antigen/teichoic acid export membrane protein